MPKKKKHTATAASDDAAPSAAAAPAASAAASPSLVLSLLLHHAAFRNDAAELERLLSERRYDINAVDAFGNTALHIAVMLQHRACVDCLLAHNAKLSLKNGQGFSPIHEATSIGDRDMLRQLWTEYKKRVRDSQELSGFISHLQSVPDFRATFQWKVGSWIPFVGRFLPSDSITLSKRGSFVRVDTNMLEFEGMRWKHHPFSFLLKPRTQIASPRAAAAAAPAELQFADNFAAGSPEAEACLQNPRQPYLVFTLDHSLQKWQCVSTEEEKENKAAERERRHKAAEDPLARADPAVVAAAASSASVAAAATPVAAVPLDVSQVDLEYELDDFQCAPIASAFSPGRLQFKPVTARKINSWSSWTSLLGYGTAPQRTEQVHQWNAAVWTVDDIRLHTLKRFEHLTKEEIAAIQARNSNFKSMVTNPLKLKQHLQEAAEEHGEGSDDDSEPGENAAADPEAAAAAAKRRASRFPPHRTSLPPPAPSLVSFAAYFHVKNQTAYTAVDLEEVFDAARDQAVQEGRAEVTEEAVELKEDDEEDEASADESKQDSEGAELDLSAAEMEAAAALPAPSNAPIEAAPAYSLAPDSDATPYIHLGRPMLRQETRKKYNARLWLAGEDFPLKMETIVHVAELLFAQSIPQLVAKFRHFALSELPDGFPVRVHAPLFGPISADISISHFEEGADIVYSRDNPAACVQDEALYFSIPPTYSREEESEEEAHKRQQRYRKRWKADGGKSESEAKK